MSPFIQGALESWSFPVVPSVALVFSGFFYLRGWNHLRSVSVIAIPTWRAGSFLLGLFLVWVTVASPLAAFDEEQLTVHMTQHLLLMTFGPAFILLGAPFIPFLHGLPRQFVRSVLGPLFRWPLTRRGWRALSQPVVCWVAAAAALVGWHVPSVFTLALQSEAWHVAEHACFLGSGLLFWWPVIQPWPSVARWSRWCILLYLFLATLPCDILSGYLVFCDRIVYDVYLLTQKQIGISALDDQQCAGALMWTCVTIVYLIAAVIIATQLLSGRNTQSIALLKPKPPNTIAPQTSEQRIEVS